MCLQLHSWNSIVFLQFSPFFLQKISTLFIFSCWIPPQRCLEPKILTHPTTKPWWWAAHPLSERWGQWPETWNPWGREWPSDYLVVVPSTVVSLTFPIGFIGIESPTSLGIFFVHSLEICPKQNFTAWGGSLSFHCASYSTVWDSPACASNRKRLAFKDTTGHRCFDQKICWKIWRKSSKLEKFLDMETLFFSILQGDSNRIEVLAELNASKTMTLLPYQVPSSRCIFMWSWWLLQ